MRKYARETAFSMIYGYLMTGDKEIEIPKELFEMKNLDETDVKYVFDIYNGVIENIGEYEKMLVDYSDGFRLERIYKIDKALIFTAMSEICVVKTPVPVVVNEIVDFARKYSTEKSMGFVNGILGRFVREQNIASQNKTEVKNSVDCADTVILQKAILDLDGDN